MLMGKNKHFNRVKTKNINDFFRLIGNLEPSFKEDIITEDNKFYLLPKDVRELKNTISRSVFSAGSFLGEKKKGDFYPSFPLIELLSKESNKKIIVDKKTEWLFICGRDIFTKSISEQTTEKGVAFVYNKRDELLGIAKFNGKEVTNLLDRGDYLRREMK